MSDIPRCGFIGYVNTFIRRVMCARTRRGSNESCYRELDDQDTKSENPVSTDSTPSDPCKLKSQTQAGITFQDEMLEVTADNLEIILLNEKKPIGRFHSVRRNKGRRTLSGLNEALLDDYYPFRVQELPNHLLSQRILATSTAWDFDTHDLDEATGGRCLPVLGMHLLTRYGLMDYFELSPTKCWKLFKIIDENYHASNFYHNSVHATDVTQAVHCFLQQPRLLKCIKPLEILMVLLAAITHDLDHPGVNHSFLVATKHPLAIMFKDKELGVNDRTPPPLKRRRGRRLEEMMKVLASGRVDRFSELRPEEESPRPFRKNIPNKPAPPPVSSVLEHHHWRIAYSCILESGIFNHMPEKLPDIKWMLKSFILATDITQQNLYLNVFKKHLSRNSLDMSHADHRHIVLQMALKAADISNPGRPWTISNKWSKKVCSEFYAQGDQERKLNLKISNLCDRQKDSVSKIQTGFFRYVVMPLYSAWHSYLFSELSKSMIQNLINNDDQWVQKIKNIDEQSKSVTQTITDADMVENDLDSSTHLSGSSELLVGSSLGSGGFGSAIRVPRRGSHSPIRTSIKEAIRRYSAPLHTFNDYRPRSRARSSVSEIRLREDLHDIATNDGKPRNKSMLEIAMAVMTNRSPDPASAKGTPTPPPCEGAPAHPPAQTLNDFNSPRRMVGIEYIIQAGDSDSEASSSSEEKGRKKIGSVIMEESSVSSGSQLTPAGLNGVGRFLLPSRPNHTSSAPCSEGRLDSQTQASRHVAKTVTSSCEMLKYTPAKDATDEITDVLLPKLSLTHVYQRRRGSAPAPVAVSDLQRLTSSLSLQLGIRKQSSSCQQKVTIDETPVFGFARRGSLPVEAFPHDMEPKK